MSTLWFYPNTITQTCEVDEHVKWSGEESGFGNAKQSDNSYLSTTRELLHIANSVVNDIKEKTYFLHLTDFNIQDVPETISGIEVEVSVRRGGRITDETVQLRYNDVEISDNKADFHLDTVKIYGASNDTWGATITPEMIQDPRFGVTLRYQSHPNWPHKESPKIDYVKVRVW